MPAMPATSKCWGIHHMALIKESHLGTPLSCWMPRMRKQLPWMKGQAGSRLISTDHGGLGWPQMTRNMLMVSSHCVWRCAYESYHVHDLICYIFPILSLISWIRNDSNVCRTIHCGTSASASGAGRWMLWFMILAYIDAWSHSAPHSASMVLGCSMEPQWIFNKSKACRDAV